MQHAMWWKLYSEVIDLFILDWSGLQFNIITFPKARVMRFKINNHLSYFPLSNDTIMHVWFIQLFALAFLDEFIHSFIHSIIPTRHIHLPTDQTNRCQIKLSLLLGSWM